MLITRKKERKKVTPECQTEGKICPKVNRAAFANNNLKDWSLEFGHCVPVLIIINGTRNTGVWLGHVSFTFDKKTNLKDLNKIMIKIESRRSQIG